MLAGNFGGGSSVGRNCTTSGQPTHPLYSVTEHYYINIDHAKLMLATEPASMIVVRCDI